MNDVPIMAGGVPILAPSAENMQLNMLIWGDSGAGKTTLAATAPGTKLFVMLDPGGDLSLAGRSDVATLNLTSEPASRVMTQFRMADPYDLRKVLTARPDYETVVVDSMTTLAYAALQEAVLKAGGAKISMEQPGMNGYAYRNAALLRCTVAIMRICAEMKRHLILTTHEGSADRDTEGHVLSVTMALSEGVANQVGLRFNEVWHLNDNGKDHVIAVRPCRLRKPMKTRLFNATQPEFVWHYDPNTHTGEGIADWYHAWQAGGGKKLPLPVHVKATTSRGVNKK
jgi:hypothetical protein